MDSLFSLGDDAFLAPKVIKSTPKIPRHVPHYSPKPKIIHHHAPKLVPHAPKIIKHTPKIIHHAPKPKPIRHVAPKPLVT